MKGLYLIIISHVIKMSLLKRRRICEGNRITMCNSVYQYVILSEKISC